MTLTSKENRNVSMITDRDGLLEMVVKIIHLGPNELNTMKVTAAPRLINGVKQWTWRLDYTADVGSKLV